MTRFFKKCTLLLLLLVAVGSAAAQQRSKEYYSPNMSRALEYLNNGDAGNAMKYLDLEIASNAKNGYAHAWKALLLYEDDYRASIVMESVDNAIKFLPKKDKEYLAFAYINRGDVFLNLLDDINSAIADYSKAITLEPTSVTGYKKRGEAYFLLDEYDLADADYQRMLQLDPSNVIGYMGLGRNAKMQGKHQEAIQYYNKVLKLNSSSYSSAYAFRAESYFKLKKYNEAANDIVAALDIDGDNKAYRLMHDMADSAFSTINARLKIQRSKSPNAEEWPYYIGCINEYTSRYAAAIKAYKEGYQIQKTPVFASSISECLIKMGDPQHALEYAQLAMENDTTDMEKWARLAYAHYHLGDYAAAERDMDQCVSLDPETAECYNIRGTYRWLQGNIDGAEEDYSAAIILAPDVASNYITRGKLHFSQGDKEAANADFQKVIELDSNLNAITCLPDAYAYLGQSANAERFIDSVRSQGQSYHYHVASVYAILNKPQEAIEELQLAFEEDHYRLFQQIEQDKDFTNLRDNLKFKALIEHYKAQTKEEIAGNAEILGEYVEEIVEVPFEKRGGVTEIKCSINGLPLHFIFDTGAADVTISMVEATFMLKNKYLSEKDIVGSAHYMTANGEISEGTVITLNNIEIGGLKLNNVRASVVKSQNAPLLLGQTVLQRLGKIEIDNERKVLKITYRKEL